MACFKINNLSFSYPAATKKALTDISLVIEEGEFVLVCGPSGSGKTTLLQQLKKEIRPTGKLEGEILFFDHALETLSAKQAAAQIGFVFQDPDNQLVLNSVGQELAFALENMGYPAQEMRKRIGEMVHFFGIQEWLHQPIEQLSGGQKQIVNLASVLLLRPKVLLLDEPTAQLDPVAAKEFIHLVGRINEEFSTTIVINEHRLEELFPLATKVVLMAEGKVVYQGNSRSVCQQVWREDNQAWLTYLPALSHLYLATQEKKDSVNEQIPLTVKEGKLWLRAHVERDSELEGGVKLEQSVQKEETIQRKQVAQQDQVVKNGEAMITCREVSFQYTRGARKILHRLDCQVQKGDIFSILGGNGVGKSTLLKLILGLLKPQQGKVLYKQKKLTNIVEKERFRRLGYVDQHPRLYFLYDTLAECLYKRAEQLQLAQPKNEIEKLVNRLKLDQHCLTRHPYDVSGGEQQKAALAMVLLAQPEILLLDEPTKGLDPQTKLSLGAMLQEWVQEGLTVIMVSHDIEFVAEHASRCALLFDGQLSEAVSPHEFFSDNYFYTTVVQRVFREILPSAITFRDVMERWK